MEKIIQIDEKARIKIIPENFVLQYKKKSKNGRTAWHYGGYFGNMQSACLEYISNAPYRTIEGTEQIEKLIEVVQASTDKISGILKNIN